MPEQKINQVDPQNLAAYVRHQTSGGRMLVDRLLRIVRMEPDEPDPNEPADRVLARAVALSALVQLAAGPATPEEEAAAAANRSRAGTKL